MDALMDLTDRLSALYTGAVYDVLRDVGHAEQVLPSALCPLDPTRTLAGPVFTVSGDLDETLDPHESLLLWTGFLGAAPPGSVVVCQPRDDTVAHMGELSAETLQFRGVRGYIVDGGCRDVSFLLDRGFPVWCRYTTPRDIVGRWAVRDTGEPVQVGGVTVRTGDFVIADRDGVVVVPQHLAVDVVEAAEAVVATENLVRAAILDGVDPQEAYVRFGKF